MNTMKRRNLQFSVIAVAVLAIVAIATVLAVSQTTAPAQAQAPGTGGQGPDDPTPTPIPQLCGPGEDHFPANPDEVVNSGHYALFDGYWEDSIQTLNDNLCPPAATHKDVTTGGKTEEVTTRFKANIDVRTTIIQVNDTHKVDVVATNGAAGTTKLSLERYEEVRAGLGLGPTDPVPPGTKVHWLRLEDGTLPPSDLVLGFSTGLLSEDYWQNPETDEHGKHLEPFEYELESVRVIGPQPTDLPHVLTYWEPEMREEGKSVVVWDGLNMDTNSMPMEADEYEHLEWVFTKPGTYIVQVHLKGHVRQTKPSDWDEFKGTWQPLTDDKTVTSEVKRYVFQVGNLHLNAQPHFGVHRTIRATDGGGTKVGAPIPVYGVDSDTLEFTLAGPGHEHFRVEKVAGSYVGTAAQLVLNSTLSYDYARPYYDLMLRVKDKRDLENNADDLIDDVVEVRISVDAGTWVSVTFDNEHPHVGESIKLTANYWNRLANTNTTVHRFRLLKVGAGGAETELQRFDTSNHSHTFTVANPGAGTVKYRVKVDFGGFREFNESWSGVYPVTWRK